MATPVSDENPWAAALCIQFDPEMWFISDETNIGRKGDVEQVTLALKLCNDCPMREKCATVGMDYENIHHGIWGGLLSGERMDLAGMNKFAAEKAAVAKARNMRRATNVKRKPATTMMMDAARATYDKYVRSGNYGRKEWRLADKTGSEV